MRSTHRCPGCRVEGVPDSRLACLPCWRKLPPPVQEDIRITASYPLTHIRRRKALGAAFAVWRSDT